MVKEKVLLLLENPKIKEVIETENIDISEKVIIREWRLSRGMHSVARFLSAEKPYISIKYIYERM